MALENYVVSNYYVYELPEFCVWSPQVHHSWPQQFRAVVTTILMAAALDMHARSMYATYPTDITNSQPVNL